MNIETLIQNGGLTPAQSTILSFNPDHAGNAQAVAYMTSGHIVHTHEYGWLVWTGAYWDRSIDAVKLAVVKVLEQRASIASTQKGPSYSEVIRASRGDSANVYGTMSLLESYVHEPVERFAGSPDLLPLPDGNTLDLRTGQQRESSPDDGFTWTATVTYDETADYSEWEQFVRSSIEGGDDAYRALKMFAGYMLTARTDDEKMLYLWGEPRAGKGTFTESLSALLPRGVKEFRSFSTFTANRDQDTNRFDLAGLKDARMVFASESDRRHALNAPMIKSITGGDEQSAAFKGKDAFSYKPSYKVVLSSNYPVNADADDDGIWPRLIAIHFPYSHTDEEEPLKIKFRQERMQQAILKWAVEGAVAWYKAGRLYVPATLKDALKSRRNELDRVGEWLSQEADLSRPEAFTPYADLVASYEKWCKDNAVEPKKRNGFVESLQKKGLKEGRRYIDKKQTRVYIGIDLIDYPD